MSEWIEWNGGKRPFEGRVDVKFLCGEEHHGEFGSEWAWGYSNGPYAIVAYRPHVSSKKLGMHINFKRLHPDAKEPTYATDGAACMDVRALHGGWIEPGEATLFSTGLAFEVPEGYAMLIDSRSGHGFNHGVRLSNSLGILDSDFRGELMVKLHNDGWDRVTVNAGDRIAQFMIVEAPKFALIEVDELSPTDRGVNGLGSTGKA